MSKRLPNTHSNHALAVFTAIFVLIGALLALNVFSLSLFGYHVLSGTDVSSYSSISVARKTLYARRGYIFDANGNILAEDTVTYTLFAYLDESRPGYEGQVTAVPEESKQQYAELLAPILGCDASEILGYLEQDLYQTEFGEAGSGLSKAQKDQIEALGLYGLDFYETTARHYPYGTFASHLIGYTRYNQEDEILVGEMGIEYYLNDYLLGKNGYTQYNQDAAGRQLAGTQSEYVAPVNGNNIYLTIDKTLQQGLETLIQQRVSMYGAYAAWGGLMEVETGRMLAWATYPSFNPNDLSTLTNYLDYGCMTSYEPGSTMKTFVYAAAIDTGNYDYSATYYDHGYFYIGVNSDGSLYESETDTGNGIVTNAGGRGYGTITYSQAYYRSLNCGIANILSSMITPAVLEEYLDRFGFFQRVNTDGVNDVPGTRHMDYPADQVNTGFGQSSSVTALQMFQAYSAILNEGKMVKPYFIDRIEDPYDHSILYQGKTTVVGQPISASTAQQMLDLMRGGVTDTQYGLCQYYALPDIEIVGKTGTGQIGTENGYDPYNVTSSVVIAMPYNDPKVVYYLCIQAPADYRMNYQEEAVKQYLEKVVQYLDLSDNPEGTEQEPVNTTIDHSSSYTKIMPEVVNHSFDYVSEVLSGYNVDTITLGSGDTVLRQYPQAGDQVCQNQKVFLLTSEDSLTMPDMTGWSRHDVTVFWQLTGIAVSFDGYGYVSSQNIPAGDPIDASTEIVVTLSQ